MLKRFIPKHREAFHQILLKQIKNKNYAIIEYRSCAQFPKSVFFPQAFRFIVDLLHAQGYYNCSPPAQKFWKLQGLFLNGTPLKS